MSYEKQIKCEDCGISIPDVPEDADKEALLCDKCAQLAEMREIKEADVWADYSEHRVSDWQHEVANGDTRRGYWEWVTAKIEEEYGG